MPVGLSGRIRWAWVALTLVACTGSHDTIAGDDPDMKEPTEPGTDGGGSALVPAAGELSYYADIKPLVEAHCQECHTHGGIAPMPLESYADVKAWAQQIKRQVVARAMPPWTAGPDCNEYVADRSLSDAQIDMVKRWVDAGARAGDEKNARSAPAKPADAEFRVDVELPMPVDYKPGRTPDDYRCFVLQWPETAPAFVTGIGVRPGNRALLHHTVLTMATPANAKAYLDRDNADPGPGYECFGSGTTNGMAIEGEARAGTGMTGSTLLGAFEKAEAGQHYPYGTGVRIEPGAVIIMQQHYNSLGASAEETDRSTLQFMLEQDVKNPGRAVWLVNPLWQSRATRDSMKITANNPDATVNTMSAGSSVAGRSNFDIYWADLHMHTLGSRGKLEVVRANGKRECLLRVDDWKFEWQSTYFLKNPVSMGPGDSLYLECHWDNTADNQYIVDGQRLPVQDVWWGDGSRDEMCLGNFLVVPR